MRRPKEDFAKRATQYTGFDGGNPKAELWFCGIEYGGTDDPTKTQFIDDILKDGVEMQDDIPYFTATDKNGNPHEYKKIYGRFALAQSKIASQYYDGEPIDTWKQLAGKDGKCFSMNLYPLAFKSHDDSLWTRTHYEKTGLISKSEYKTWNLNNRFPKLKQLVTTYQPKVLICFGQSLASEFLVAFADNDDQIFEELAKVEIADKVHKSNRLLLHRKINNGKTLLLICPFPSGAKGLNSDELCKQVAEQAKSLSL